MPQRITGYTQVIGIIATPIHHSKSPMMHNTAFEALGLDYVYVAFDFGKEKLEDAVKGLRALGVRGFNISMPYKTDIMSYLDEVDDSARMIGACNTVVNDNGRFIGYNTDGMGFMAGLKDNGYNPIGKKVTLLGTGGAATAIMMQMALDGVAELSIFYNRDSSREKAAAYAETINGNTSCKAKIFSLHSEQDLRRELESSYLLVNGTNVGMGALEGQSLIPDAGYLRRELVVSDVIYNPEETALLKMAREAGCNTLNGLPMILFQGAEAFRLWTGYEMPIDRVKEVL